MHPCNGVSTRHGPLPTCPDPFRHTPPFIPSSAVPICVPGSPTDTSRPAAMLASLSPLCPAVPAAHAGLQFPVGCIHHMLNAQRVGAGAPSELLPPPASAVLTLPLDDALPTLEMQSSMLAVDLTLAAGESRSCTWSSCPPARPDKQLPPRSNSYSVALLSNLPPTFKGRAMRFSCQLIVGACWASSPFTPASPSAIFPSSPLSTPGLFSESERRQSRVMQVPIRVHNYVADECDYECVGGTLTVVA